MSVASRLFGIAGRRAATVRSSRTPSHAAGLLGLNYFNGQLEEIGTSLSCSRLHDERDDAYRQRLALRLQENIRQLHATLERVTNCKNG